MALDKRIYKALQNIVGADYISDDPVICQAYSRGGYGKYVWDQNIVKPAAVVLPKSTEEVQSIVRLANRYKFPYIPTSTLYVCFSLPVEENTVIIHLKRMEGLEIDFRNMYAVVEPYINFAQLQGECMKKGLYTMGPGCGAQSSVVANHANQGMGPLGHRTGYGNRRILATEWVLPNGELLKLGSAAVVNDYFWGEGPGPDLRGLLRGYMGLFGGLGVITKMAVKLFPLPEGKYEPIGVSPNTALSLPPDRFRWYNINFKNIDDAVLAIYEIGKAEIGAVCMKLPNMFKYVARAGSREELWKLWLDAREELEKEETNIVRVLLVGFTSAKQLEYEELVLGDIVSERGGEMRKGRPTDTSVFKPADSLTVYNTAGHYLSVKYGYDSTAHAYKFLKANVELKRKYTPPLMDDYGDIGWIQSYDLGHAAYGEFLVYMDPADAQTGIDYERATVEKDIQIKAYSGNQFPPHHAQLGPHMRDYHLLMKKLLSQYDPYNLSNPQRPV